MHLLCFSRLLRQKIYEIKKIPILQAAVSRDRHGVPKLNWRDIKKSAYYLYVVVAMFGMKLWSYSLAIEGKMTFLLY